MEQNLFLQKIQDVAHSEGYDQDEILPLFKNLSSADFICGEPEESNKTAIPKAVWQRVCSFYLAASHSPYRPRAVQVSLRKHAVFIKSAINRRIARSGIVSEPIDGGRRFAYYLNETLRINALANAVVEVMGSNERKLLLIDVELHDHHQHKLYALCSPSDVVGDTSRPWYGH